MEIQANNPLTWIPAIGLILLPVFLIGNMILGYKRSKHDTFLRVLDGFSMFVSDVQKLVMIGYVALGIWLLSSSQIGTSFEQASLDTSKIDATLFWVVVLLVVGMSARVLNAAIELRFSQAAYRASVRSESLRKKHGSELDKMAAHAALRRPRDVTLIGTSTGIRP